MKRYWIGILIVAAAFYLLTHKKEKKRVYESPLDSAEDTLPVAVSLSTPAPTAIPLTAATPLTNPAPTAAPANPPAPKEEINPYWVDRFSLRKLDLPVPMSVAELMAKLTEFKSPMLPVVLPGQEGDGDGDILTGALRGYFEASGGTYRRIQVSRVSDGISLAIEDASGGFQEWQKNDSRIKLNNFNRDPYSLVMTLPDGRVAYLKFQARIDFSEVDHKVRALKGWILSEAGRNPKVSSRMALVGDLGSEFWDTGPVDPNEQQWPSVDAIKTIMPKSPLPP